VRNVLRQSNLKLGETIIDPVIITTWLKDNRISELIEYLDVVEDSSWMNDGATIILGIKKGISLKGIIHIVFKLGALAVEASVDEFNYYRDGDQYIIRLWWD
jgi:hypothetical protein